jgi:hypothetical protein
MTRFPDITVQKWTAEGPAYTIHRKLEGRANRHRRRAGETDDEQVGPHSDAEASGPAASMVFARGDDELWAFAPGSVYSVDVLVDGESAIIYVDAREGSALESFVDGVQIMAHAPLDEDELAELLDDIGDPADALDGVTLDDVDLGEFSPPADTDVDDASSDDEDAVGGDSGKSSDEEE